MSVLDRAALEASSLADLHAIASELSIDGYRRIRKPELIAAIVARQSGEDVESPTPDSSETGENAETDAVRSSESDEDAETETAAVSSTEDAAGEDGEATTSRRRRGRRGGRGRASGREDRVAKDEKPDEKPDEEPASPRVSADDEEGGEDEPVSGVVELLPNGSGFVRVQPPEPSDDDVYISGAQVKRCELVSGDRISGPRRAPRRSERFASLVRIDTINDRPAAEVADSARFDDLPAAFPSERFKLGSDDPTVKAIEWLTPIGRGSRVTIVGPSGAGKTEALRRLATALAGIEGLQLSLALAGVRPEEISEWSGGAMAPTAAVSFAASPDAQGNAIELVVDQARRVAARGADAVVLIDTLDGVHPGVARKAIAAARNVVDGGSLTVIATASQPLGGETTVIALDRVLASTGHFPALDLVASGTIRAELLIGEDAVKTIIQSREEALASR